MWVQAEINWDRELLAALKMSSAESDPEVKLHHEEVIAILEQEIRSSDVGGKKGSSGS